MLLSTIVPAIIIVAIVYLLVIRKIRWRWLSYSLAIAIAGTLIAARAVHLVFTGVEVAGLGCLVTWADPLGYWKKQL